MSGRGRGRERGRAAITRQRARPYRPAPSIARAGQGRKDLPTGLIFDIAKRAGIKMRDKGEKRKIHCPLPLHDDRTESAFVSSRNVFFCSRCTPEGGWTAKRFAEALGLTLRDFLGGGEHYSRAALPRPAPAPVASKPREGEPRGGNRKAPDSKPAFAPEDAKATWLLALERASRRGPKDRAALDYLRARGLEGALERGAAGILAPDMREGLHPSVNWWPGAGYQLVVPLYDEAGQLVNVQARSIINPPWKGKKVWFPGGSRARGTRFASPDALKILRGESRGDEPRGCEPRGCEPVLIGEGLTDFLALSITSPIPLMAAPGTSNAAACIGPWAKARKVYLALDGDEAGARALKPASRRVRELQGTPFGVNWPNGRKDACEVLEKDGCWALLAFLARHLIGEAAR